MEKDLITKSYNFSSIFEQLSASLGNFLFIIIAANILDSLNFGLIAIQWGLIMSGLTLFFSMVLLPISSIKDSILNPSEVISHSITLTLVYLPILFLILLLGIQIIDANNIININNFFYLLLPWASLNMIYESVRWLIIRYGSFKILIFANFFRWTSFFLFLYLFHFNDLSIDWKRYIQINFIALCFWFIFIFCFYIKKQFIKRIKITINKDFFKSSFPLTFYNILKTLVNFCFITLFSRYLGLEIFGIYQAFKSLINFIGTASQYIDNHVTAFFAKNEINLRITNLMIILMILFPFIGFFISLFFKDLVVEIFFKSFNKDFNLILSIVFLGALIQLAIKPVFTEIRLNSKFYLFNYASFYMMIFFFSVMIFFLSKSHNFLFILFFEMIPYCVLLASLFHDRKKLKFKS